MITRIAGINPCQNNPKYSLNSKAKINFLSVDAFELQRKNNPSFTSANLIPRGKIINGCNKLLANVKNISDSDKIAKISNDFFYVELNELLYPNRVKAKSNEESKYFKEFRHEVINVCATSSAFVGCKELKETLANAYPEILEEKGYVNFQKVKLKETINGVKDSTEKWVLFEKMKWLESNTLIPSIDIIRALESLLKNKGNIGVSTNGLELLKDKHAKTPMDLYMLCSHPILNALKYGENKSFEIKIDKIIQNNKEKYYASFINPDTKSIPDEEIDKIVEGNFYRAPNSKGIPGTGQGFADIVGIITEKGDICDIPNLIEKGRKKGVCVRVPLIGLH